MKKFKFLPIFFAVCIFVSMLLSPAALALEAPVIKSRAAIVMEPNTGEVFYAVNEGQLVYPASTTKLMTALLAIEAVEAGNASMYDTVTATENMTYDLVSDGSTAGIMVGESMTLESLLYCTMLSSANEACNIIAEYIGGTISDFIQRMNDRAAELGCTDTHFTNTHGLPDPNHYTTAIDYCRIIQEAYKHEVLMNICATPTADIPATNLSGERHLNNSNALICADSIYGSKYVYEYAAGIKTGHTNDAGYCLISTASNGEIQLISAVFGGYTYPDQDGVNCYTNFEDSIALYEWVFNNYSFQEVLKSTETITTVPVAMGSDADSIGVRPDTSLTALLPNDCDISSFRRDVVIYSVADGKELTAPISAGEVLGEITISAGDVKYGTAKLVASSSVELSRLQYMKSEILSTLKSKPVIITAGILLFLFLIYLILVIRYRIIHLRHKRAVRAARQEQMKRRQTELQRQAAATASSSAAPPITYFTQSDAPAPQPAQATTVPQHTSPQEVSIEDRKAQAERDYFEEFFRQK